MTPDIPASSLLLKGRVCSTYMYTPLNCGGYCHERIIRIIPVRRHLQIWVFSIFFLNLSPTWMTLWGLTQPGSSTWTLFPSWGRFTCLSLLTWLTSCLTLLMLPKSWHCFWIEIRDRVLEKRHRVTLFLCQVKKEHRRLAPQKLCLSLREIERGFVVRAPGLE